MYLVLSGDSRRKHIMSANAVRVSTKVMQLYMLEVCSFLMYWKENVGLPVLKINNFNAKIPTIRTAQQIV